MLTGHSFNTVSQSFLASQALEDDDVFFGLARQNSRVETRAPKLPARSTAACNRASRVNLTFAVSPYSFRRTVRSRSSPSLTAGVSGGDVKSLTHERR